MKKGLKIAIIGSGSTYTPELIEGLINKRETLPLDELILKLQSNVGTMKSNRGRHTAY